MAIKVQTLIDDFLQAYKAGWKYVSPGSTTWRELPSRGVDCSGLFTAAFKRHGETCYHGSNTMARLYTDSLQKLTKTSQLQPGFVVYKWQNDGDEPQKYQADGKGNFHHVGLVVSTSPLKIVHASSVAGKVTQDTSIKKWAYCGLLKRVKYAQETQEESGPAPQIGDDTMLYQAKVTTASSALNVRSGPSTSASRIGSVPRGAVVNVYGESDGFLRISYNTVTEGWCSARYLTKVPGTEQDDGPADDDDIDDEATFSTDQVTAIKTALERLTEASSALTNVTNLLRNIASIYGEDDDEDN